MGLTRHNSPKFAIIVTGNLWDNQGNSMDTIKATLVASRVSFIESALEKLVHDFENAEGSHKEALGRLVVAVQEALRKHGRHSLH